MYVHAGTLSERHPSTSIAFPPLKKQPKAGPRIYFPLVLQENPKEINI